LAHGGARIVIADDLRDETTCALKVASALAANSGEAALKHVHAYGAPAEHLSELIVLFWELATSFVDRNVEPGDMNRYEIACRREALARRGHMVAPILQFGHCRYDNELVSGTPVESVAEYARLMRADLVVFGHHKAVHTQPLSFGHVTPHAMLGLSSAVMMVPEGAERLANRLANAAVRRAAS
jgi:nucleotide-binding universal stress UspA family protein